MNVYQTVTKTLLCAGLTALSFSIHAKDVAQAEWPQWRGADRAGLSPDTGNLKAWPAGGPALLWKATGLGTGYSSISISGGKIFTMGDAAESSMVLAYDMDGKQLWTAKVGKIGGNYPGTRCTPTVDGNVLYALGQFGDIVCLETATGKEVWHKNMSAFGGAPGGWNYTESLLVDGDQVVCTPGGAKGAMVALNKKTGELLWQSADFKDPAQYSSMVAATIGGVKQYVQMTMDHVVGIAPDSGKVLWSAPRKGATAVIPTPIVFKDHVFVTSGYGIGCNLFKISKEGAEFKATEVYANKNIINHHGGVILVGDYIFGHSDRGGLTCMEFLTGTVKWQNPSVGKGSIAYADGCIYLRSEGPKGTVALVSADPTGYKELGRFDQPERAKENSWAHPIVLNGRLYLRDKDNLFCYDVKAK